MKLRSNHPRRNCLAWLVSGALWAITPVLATEVLIEAAGTYGLTSSTLDRIDGAAYDKKLGNLAAAELAVGFSPFNHTYVGAYAEYWMGSAKFQAGLDARDVKLQMPFVGLEVAYLSANPRVFKMFGIGVGSPVGAKVNDSGGASYRLNTLSLGYRAKIAVGFRLGGPVWLVLRGGYRMHRFGNFNSGGTPLIPSGAGLDLSGAFAGGGIAVSI